ncbi:MAG TPA: glutathione S-transferase family protein [Candidatus Binataceae bacterium]|jgi:glutathione S-transferase/RNA polymerase-associated protein
MLKLWEHPLSPFAQKVKIALFEKGIPFETETPNAFTGGTTDYLKISPRLEVPALQDGELTIFDSTVILEYLEDKWPRPAMLPPPPAERARVRMIEEICDTYYEAINWGVMEIKVFKRASGDLADALLARAASQIAGVHARLERELGERQFFNGESFGWGDLSVHPYVNTSKLYGILPPDGSRLAAWLDRVAARESVKRSAEAGAQSLTGVGQLPALVEAGRFVRQYRDHRLEWMLRSGGLEIVLRGIEKKNIRFSTEIG